MEENMDHKIFMVPILIALIALVSCQKQEESADQSQTQATKLSAAQVKEAITTHIQSITGAEGTFAIEDAVEARTRQLTFSYVHDSVHETEDGRYYACVDFTEAPADTLDLDIYVSVDSEGTQKVSEVVIHKVNGKSRL
jgi:hypothetical protein